MVVDKMDVAGAGRLKSRIVNVENVPFQQRSHGETFECQIAPVGAALDSKELGSNVTVVPPGRRAFPYYAHRGGER